MSPHQIEFAHWLDAHSAELWPFFLVVPFWLLGVAGILRKRPELFAPGLLGFFACISSSFIFQNFIARAGLAEIQPALHSPIILASIDGAPIANAQALIGLLRQQNSLTAQHSSPGQMHHLVLKTKSSSVDLDIARDSANPNEFWVWNPSFKTTTELGRFAGDGHVLDQAGVTP